MPDPQTNAIIASFVNYKTFTVNDDETEAFHNGRRVRCKLDGDNRAHGNVESSSYNGSITTVILDEESDDLTSELTGVWYGVVSAYASDSSMPIHPHTDNETGGKLEQRGLVNLSNGDSSKEITFDTEFSSADYMPFIDIINDSDDDPYAFSYIIKRETTKMTIKLGGAVDTDNYKISWRVIES